MKDCEGSCSVIMRLIGALADSDKRVEELEGNRGGMENCEFSNCTCDVRKKDCPLEQRLTKLRVICEKLETELADANSFIKMVDAETEEGLYDDDYE